MYFVKKTRVELVILPPHTYSETKQNFKFGNRTITETNENEKSKTELTGNSY